VRNVDTILHLPVMLLAVALADFHVLQHSVFVCTSVSALMKRRYVRQSFQVFICRVFSYRCGWPKFFDGS